MSTETFVPEFDRAVPTATEVPIAPPLARQRLDAGVVLATIEELVPGLTSKQSLYQVSATFRVTQPEAFAGAQIWENFVIGDQQDSQAERPETWGRTVGGNRFRHMVNRAKVPFGRMSTMVQALSKRSIVLDVYTFVEPAKLKDGSANLYAGKTKRRIRDFYAVGEKPLAARGKDWDGTDTRDATPSSVTFDGGASVTCPVCGLTTTAADFPGHAETHETLR